jgi:betaine-aldehyde dehydrogenase
VLLKPSELAPDSTVLIRELLAEADLAGFVAEVVEGGPEAARVLIDSGKIAKLVFFGRSDTGRELGALCTARGIPFVLEMGGGSTALVLAEANLDRAAAGIAWSGFYAGGHSCVGTGRVYVESSVKDPFLERLEREVQVNWQTGGGSVGSTISESDSILVNEALEEGARLLTGPGTIDRDAGIPVPCVVVDVPPGSAILTQELFTPLIAVCAVENTDLAVHLANSGCQMLGCSVWSRNRRRALDIAGRLHADMIWINDTSFGLPNLPWGGRGDAGWGSLFSRYSLHEAARLKWVSRNPSSGRRPWWPPYTSLKMRAVRILARLLRL